MASTADQVRSFLPSAVNITPYVIITMILIIASAVFGSICCLPPKDGIEVTDKDGKKSKNKVIGPALFALVVIFGPIVLMFSIYKLHVLIKNPRMAASAVGVSMFRDALN